MFPFGKPYSPPSDKLIHTVAQLGLKPGPSRTRLSHGIYQSSDPEDRIGRIEHAYQLAQQAKSLETRLKRLTKDGRLESHSEDLRISEALTKELISAEDAALLRKARAAMLNAISVDAFEPEELNPRTAKS
jgi:acyl-CoA dehydrogenase